MYIYSPSLHTIDIELFNSHSIPFPESVLLDRQPSRPPPCVELAPYTHGRRRRRGGGGGGGRRGGGDEEEEGEEEKAGTGEGQKGYGKG